MARRTLKYGILLVGSWLLGCLSTPAANLSMPPEIYGAYAAQGNCGMEPRVVVNANGLFVESQGRRIGPLPSDVCYSCAGGVRYEGIQRWVYLKSGSRLPLVLMFNAGEKPGLLEIANNDVMPLSGPFLTLFKNSSMKRCETGANGREARSLQGMASASARPPNSSANPSAIQTPAQPALTPPETSGTLPDFGQPTPSVAHQFVSLLENLMPPASLPGNSFYDWRDIERVPAVQWAPLPPEMLDKPTSDGHYFRRQGMVSLGGRNWRVLAAGARTMVMSHHFLNTGAPVGDSELLGTLRRSGFTVKTARCPIMTGLNVPQWYQLNREGKRTAFLWIMPAHANRLGREGFTLNLSDHLPPLTRNEKRIYTECCP